MAASFSDKQTSKQHTELDLPLQCQRDFLHSAVIRHSDDRCCIDIEFQCVEYGNDAHIKLYETDGVDIEYSLVTSKVAEAILKYCPASCKHHSRFQELS